MGTQTVRPEIWKKPGEYIYRELGFVCIRWKCLRKQLCGEKRDTARKFARNHDKIAEVLTSKWSIMKIMKNRDKGAHDAVEKWWLMELTYRVHLHFHNS